MNNENEELAKNGKRSNDRKIKRYDNMKLCLNRTISEKKRKKVSDEITRLEILLVNIKYAKNPNKLQNALKYLNKIHVVDKNSHEIKEEILLDYTGTIEKIGKK